MEPQEIADALRCNEQGCPCQRGGSNNWQVHCPSHDDRTPSLTVREGDGKALVYCHAGCEQGEVIGALAKMGLWAPTPGSGKPKAYYDEPITSWSEYRSADGSLAYAVGRTPGKQFPVVKPDGAGGWSWKMGSQPRILYRLPELLASDPAGPVFFVEGEKDVDRLLEAGLVATTSPFGVGKSRYVDLKPLANRMVVVIPDNDQAGREHAAEVAASLRSVAREVVLLGPLPGVGPSCDVSDYLDQGHGPDELMKLVAEARSGEGPPPTSGGQVLAPPPRLSTDAGGSSLPGPAGDAQRSLKLVTAQQLIAEPDEEEEWLVHSLLPKGGVMIMVAPYGGMKTWLALDFARSVASGQPFLGFPTRQGDAIFIDEEGGRSRMRRRLRRLALAKPGVDNRLHLSSFAGVRLTDPAWLEVLRQEIARVKASLVVVDTLVATTAGSDENSSGDMRAFFNNLVPLRRDYDCAFLVLHHPPKKGRGPRGSSDIPAAVDSSLEITKKS